MWEGSLGTRLVRTTIDSEIQTCRLGTGTSNTGQDGRVSGVAGDVIDVPSVALQYLWGTEEEEDIFGRYTEYSCSVRWPQAPPRAAWKKGSGIGQS